MSHDTDIAILYVPCGSEPEAVQIATTLLEERLVACGNIIRSRSLYRWDGKLADDIEHILLCKTARSQVSAARQRVEQLHSYDTPCIISWDLADVNDEYEKWVLGEVSGGAIALAARGPEVAP